MTAPDQLAAIEARAERDIEDMEDLIDGGIMRTLSGRRIARNLSLKGFGRTTALLAMVREQRAALERATAILDEWDSYKAFPDAEDSQRWYSLGKRHAADAIRAAITATEGA
jgi:hypothetical protein